MVHKSVIGRSSVNEWQKPFAGHRKRYPVGRIVLWPSMILEKSKKERTGTITVAALSFHGLRYRLQAKGYESQSRYSYSTGRCGSKRVLPWREKWGGWENRLFTESKIRRYKTVNCNLMRFAFIAEWDFRGSIIGKYDGWIINFSVCEFLASCSGSSLCSTLLELLCP